MIAVFYDSPSSKAWTTLADLFKIAVRDIVSYSYTKKHCGVGNYTLDIVQNEKYLDNIVVNGLVYIDGDWLIVRDVQHDYKQITITGTDLNGWLNQRITTIGTQTIAGTKGYDVVQGTTYDCVLHYLNNNAISPADSNRKIPHLTANGDVTGKDNDSYMVRLKPLSEVVDALCKNAGVGYKIECNDDNFVFKLTDPTDHSATQILNDVVVYSTTAPEVLNASFGNGNNDLINAVYATAKEVTQLVNRDNTAKVGVERFETAIDVSVDRLDDVNAYALEQISDNVSSDTCDVELFANNDYGNRYQLGDIISVKDRASGNLYNKQIIEAVKNISQGAKKITLTLGDVNTKLLNKIEDDTKKTLKSEIGRVEQKILTVDDKITAVDNSVKELTPTNWIAPVFYNNSTYWTNGATSINSRFKPVEYRRIGKQVFIDGFFKCNDLNNSFSTEDEKKLFALPAGYRPRKSLYWRLPMSGQQYAKVYVTEGGTVGMDFTTATTLTASTWFNFNNVSFFVD